MIQKELIFNGKEKKIFATEDNDKVLIHYKDVTTAFGNIKMVSIPGKGELNCSISAFIFDYLNRNGIETHFISKNGPAEMLCRKIELIPLEIIVRNYSAGSFATRLGVENGSKLLNPVVGFKYNCDELGDPIITCDEITALQILTSDELNMIREVALKVNGLLIDIFKKADIRLLDFKMEFGRSTDNGHIIVSDEISPDTCRLWDEKSQTHLDKDLFRHNLGDIGTAYEEVRRRLGL